MARKKENSIKLRRIVDWHEDDWNITIAFWFGFCFFFVFFFTSTLTAFVQPKDIYQAYALALIGTGLWIVITIIGFIITLWNNREVTYEGVCR